MINIKPNLRLKNGRNRFVRKRLLDKNALQILFGDHVICNAFVMKWFLHSYLVRIIKSVPIRTESAPMFQSLELLSVFEIYTLYTFKIAMFMLKYVHKQVTDCVNELFTELMKSIIVSPATKINSAYHYPDWAQYINLCALKFLSYGTQFVIMLMFLLYCYIQIIYEKNTWWLVHYQCSDERFHGLPFWDNGHNSY